MPISSACPSCQKRLSLPDHAPGKSVKCPACGKSFVVPAKAAPAAPAPAKAPAAAKPAAPDPLPKAPPPAAPRPVATAEQAAPSAPTPPRRGLPSAYASSLARVKSREHPKDAFPPIVKQLAVAVAVVVCVGVAFYVYIRMARGYVDIQDVRRVDGMVAVGSADEEHLVFGERADGQSVVIKLKVSQPVLDDAGVGGQYGEVVFTAGAFTLRSGDEKLTAESILIERLHDKPLSAPGRLRGRALGGQLVKETVKIEEVMISREDGMTKVETATLRVGSSPVVTVSEDVRYSTVDWVGEGEAWRGAPRHIAKDGGATAATAYELRLAFPRPRSGGSARLFINERDVAKVKVP